MQIKSMLSLCSLLSLLFASNVYATACPAAGTVFPGGTVTYDPGCSITGNLATPIFEADGGSVTFSNGNSITQQGAGNVVLADGGSTVDLNGTFAITSSSNTNSALRAQAGSTITMQQGTITNNGSAAAVQATGGGHVILGTIGDVDITSVGTALSIGNGSSIEMDGGTITMNSNATAVDASGLGSTVNLGTASTGVDITAQGTALLASGTINMTNGSATTSGNTSTVLSILSSHVNLTDVAISNTFAGVAGASTAGIRAASGIVTMSGGSVSTLADNMPGIIVSNQGSVTLLPDAADDGVAIQTSGQGAFGVSMANSGTNTFSVTNGSITTTGANANGINISQTGINTATLTNTQVHTSGANAAAINFNPSSAVTNTVTVDSSTLAADNGAIIVAGGTNSGAESDVNFSNGTVANAAAGQNFITKTNGTLTFNGIESTFSGDIAVSDVGATNLTFDASQYTGAINSTAVTNNIILGNLEGSTWNLNGNSTLNSVFNNAAAINFTSAGGFKTLTVNNYQALNGPSITLNTLLGADSTTSSDQLIIDGGSATGTTTLHIVNKLGAGALTTGNGILVVDAINGGVTAVNAFTQGGEIVAGPYQYTLFRGGLNGSDPDDWFLRSTSLAPGPTPTPDLRPIVSLYTAIPSLALLYDQMAFDTLHQRVGYEEQMLADPNCGHSPYISSGWARVVGENGERDNGGIFKDGPNFDYDFRAAQGGIDLYRQRHCNGSTDFAGVLGMIGNNDGSVDDQFGRHAGTDDFNAYTGGLYWTHFGASGWYTDAIAEGTLDQITSSNVEDNNKLNTNAKDWGASLESGYPIYLRNSFTLEPQAQISYQHLNINSQRVLDTDVDFSNTQSTAGRLGALLSKTWCGASVYGPRQITAWVSASAWHQFEGNSTTSFTSDAGLIPFGSTIGGSWADVGVGVSAQLVKNGSIFLTYDRQQLFAGGTGHANQGVIGVRVNV